MAKSSVIMSKCIGRLLLLVLFLGLCRVAWAEDIYLPSKSEVYAKFDKEDKARFFAPSKVYYPEVWVDCIGGNLSKEGILADLEAIAEAGFSGVQFFFGNRGGAWPGVNEQILCLSAEWDDFVQYAAEQAKRLGLRFTLQNCPGWAMAGGPWIEPSNSMRHLVWTESNIAGGKEVDVLLPVSAHKDTDWRDYQDLMVLAFPKPLGDIVPLVPESVESSLPGYPWQECVTGTISHALNLPPSPQGGAHWIDVTFPKEEVIRSIEFSSINGYFHWYCYEPGVSVSLEAIVDGDTIEVLHTDLPASNWQDNRNITLSCNEVAPTRKYRISIANKHGMALWSVRMWTGARKNNWESEAGWVLRNLMCNSEKPNHNPLCYIKKGAVLDISKYMSADGHLRWVAPKGEWSVLRIGHINSGMKNAPAPPEATGWECNKYDVEGAEKHFAGYVGRLNEGPLKGLLNGMLLDSWECETQTWTKEMEEEFRALNGYDLRPWLPALMGYVIDTPETTSRFLRDWRATINHLVVHRFYKRMSELGHASNLSVIYETAGGDVFPSDIMEYFKFADIPMCEFWQHQPEIFVGSLNFKPIKPTVSAARLYGKQRVGAEAFTSLQLTWDEQFRLLKETANKNRIEGATHFAFQAYTHNPLPDVLVPGSSFGSDIGTPFMRSQTWWRYMHEFTTYIARSTYMLERGRPVSDFLWYLGDEIDHKPDQLAPFPLGYKFDYCNPDVLLNRLSVTKQGMLATPEGITYRAMYLPRTYRMLPETLEKLVQLVQQGATIIGERPLHVATLSAPEESEKRFRRAVDMLWGEASDTSVRILGKGKVLSQMTIDEAIRELKLTPDVEADGLLWLHRQTKGADWYYICPSLGAGFEGSVLFNQQGAVELWDPVTGNIEVARTEQQGTRTLVHLNLSRGETRFVVFHKNKKHQQPPLSVEKEVISLAQAEWTIAFPDGWGVAPRELSVRNLMPWKDFPLSVEGRAFSGTATYSTTLHISMKDDESKYLLDLGRVESFAKVTINGISLPVLWTYPYRVDITKYLVTGDNALSIDVTNTWFNRLVYDAGRPEEQRKTWTINGPSKDAPLRDSGLLGPVKVLVHQDL